MKTLGNLSILDLYTQTIEQAPICIYWKDKDFNYLGGNLLLTNYVGLSSSSELVGKTDYDLFPKKLANIIRKNDHEVITKGIPCVFEEHAVNSLGVKAIYLTQKIPLLDENQEIIGLAGLSFDITIQKQTEEKIRRAKEKAEMTLSSILENLPGHVYWKNKSSIYQGCNLAQAQSAGFSKVGDMIGKTDYEMPWRHEAGMLRESDLAVIKNKETLTREEISQLANSNEVSVFLTKKSPLFNKKREVIGILGVSFDISDRKKIEKELYQAKNKAETANNAKIEFIANMSHDLRTPLTGILGMSKLLEENAEDATQKQYAHWLSESGAQILNMLNDILDTISAENIHETDLRERPFNLRSLIQDILQLERPSMLTKGIGLVSEIDTSIPASLISDATKLHRILLNLFGNAIKFTQTGQIKVTVKILAQTEKDVLLHFCIADTGIGIPDDLQHSVFDRFFRGTPSYKGVYSGHGLGLYIAQSYAHLLGSKIEFKSVPGKGTAFYFDLPLKIDTNHSRQIVSAQFEQPVTLPASPLTPDAIAPEAPHLLLVEDNNIALIILQNQVGKAGCRFTSAVDGEIALNLAKTQTFDLIITDLGLPKLSGIEFTQKLRTFEKEQGKKLTPIVGLTAHAEESIKKECLQSGMNEAITKPMTLKTLKKIRTTYCPTILKTVKTKPQLGKLGIDLPDSEKELFQLDKFALLDENIALATMNNDVEILKSILTCMLEEQIPEDEFELQEAYAKRDWENIAKIAHRMKGGLLYCGANKLIKACQYMERYYKAGHTSALDALYKQLFFVMEETVNAMKQWFTQ